MLIKIKDPKKPGDYLMMSDRDFDPAKHERFDAVAGQTPAPPPSNAGTPVAQTTADSFIHDILGGTVKAAAAAIRDVADVCTLDAIEAAEAAGENRGGVIKAISARREQLKTPPQ